MSAPTTAVRLRVGAASRRPVGLTLMVATLLLGLFVMHGLSTSHDVMLSMDHEATATSITGMPMHHMAPLVPAMDASTLVHDAMTGGGSLTAPNGPVTLLNSTLDRMGGMGALCLAVLTGLWLMVAAGLLTARRSLTRPEATVASSARWLAAAAAPRPPDLARLSVLRT